MPHIDVVMMGLCMAEAIQACAQRGETGNTDRAFKQRS
jgi:hypothetical protein